MDVVSTGYISNQSTITGNELIRSIVLRMHPQQPEVSPLEALYLCQMRVVLQIASHHAA